MPLRGFIGNVGPMREWAVDAFHKIYFEGFATPLAESFERWSVDLKRQANHLYLDGRRAFPVAIAIVSIGWFAYATKVDRKVETDQVAKRYGHLINYNSSLMHRE